MSVPVTPSSAHCGAPEKSSRWTITLRAFPERSSVQPTNRRSGDADFHGASVERCWPRIASLTTTPFGDHTALPVSSTRCAYTSAWPER